MKLLALLALASLPAQAREVGGITIPDSSKIEGQSLALNGAGVRSKFMFKVYVGAFYVTTKSTNFADHLSSTSTKLVKLHFLRDVEKAKMNQAWQEGYDKNCGSECAAFKDDLFKLNSFSEDMKEKDTLAFLLTSEKVVYFKNDQKRGEVDRKGFSKLVLSIFLGEKPADATLKKGMLGL